MERNYFSVLFYIKKAKLLKNGEAPICLRITVNRKRAEIQICSIHNFHAIFAIFIDIYKLFVWNSVNSSENTLRFDIVLKFYDLKMNTFYFNTRLIGIDKENLMS